MSQASAAEARHEIANLLHTYTDIADRKDVSAAVALLGAAEVSFPAGGFDHPSDAEPFFRSLWSAPVRHRHDVTNLIVHGEKSPELWLARAHYTRWFLDPTPALHTLGEYTLTVDPADWSFVALTVTRTWARD